MDEERLPFLANTQEWLESLMAGRVTRRGRDIGRYIAAHPQQTAFASAADVGGLVGVSTATVVRFAQTLGFKGWPAFQYELRNRVFSSRLPSDILTDSGRVLADEPVIAALQQDMENLRAAVEVVDAQAVAAVAKNIASAHRTLVVSSGSYAAVGHVLAHLGSVMGYPITLEMRGGAHLVSALAGLREGDCLVAITFWRLLRDVVQAAQHCKRAGIATAAITDSLYSPLAATADHVIVVPSEGLSFFQSVTAPLSITYGLLAELHRLGGDDVVASVARTQQLWEELDVLYAPSRGKEDQ